MDCDNARLYLPYLTPGGKDLDGAEADELRAHLEQCSACNALAMNARRLDQHLGRAMRAVEVPVGMKPRILERLGGDRGGFKRRLRQRISWVAAVAASLLVTFLAYGYWTRQRLKDIDPAYLVQSASVGGHNQEEANKALVRLGAQKLAPNYNYAYLFGEPALAEPPGHEGRKVPQFTFIRQPVTLTQARKEPEVAIVYAFPKGQYDVGRPGPADSNYRYKVAVRTQDDPTCDYLILYNGKDYNWLLLSDEQ